jgi:small-conductance mechanosensitive channel
VRKVARLLFFFAAVLGAAAMAVVPAAAHAKTQDAAHKAAPPKLPEPLTHDAIRELVSRLSDSEVRALLIQQLDRAAAPAAKSDANLVMSMESEAQRARQRMDELWGAFMQLPETLSAMKTRFETDRAPGHLWMVALACALMLALAYLAERIYRYLLRRQRAHLDDLHDEPFGTRWAHNLMRLLLDAGGIVVFGAAALLFFYIIYHGHEQSRLVTLGVLNSALVFRLVQVGSRFLLEPRAPALRLLPLTDRAAQRVHAGLLQIVAAYVVLVLPLFLLLRLGAPQATADVLALLAGVICMIVGVATVWSVREDIAGLIRGPGAPGAPRRIVAELWPVLATAYLIVVYIALVLDIVAGRPLESRGILSLALLVGLPIVDFALVRALAAMKAKSAAAADAGSALPAYEPVLRKAIHIVVIVAGALLLADIWSVNLMTMAERGLGQRISGALLGILVILLLSYMLWQFAKTAIERTLQREGGLPAQLTDDEAVSTVATRLGTILPILRITLQVTILVVATLSILAALGIDIVPLLAGAGVIGVAIGFGSQSLVRDIVSGVFFLADDAFRVGEYIEVGESKGTIEKISIRSLFLRHHRGPINILPYGEIKRLRNMSRDWVIDKMTIGITYDSDFEKARKLIKKIGQELAANPEYAGKIFEPLKMQGVEQFGDFAIQIRLKMKTKPNEQFVIRRKAYAMIKKTFDENGIKFAYPTVQIAHGAESSEATAAAATRALGSLGGGASTAGG